MNVLIDLGFGIEEFGINTIIIKTHPIWLLEGYEESQIRKIIDLVLTMQKKFEPVKFNDVWRLQQPAKIVSKEILILLWNKWKVF